MASGDLKTSTPLQCRYDSGYGSYGKGYNVSCEAIELSPIRKQPSLKSNFLKVCSILNNGAVKKWNQAVDKVSKKLMFTSNDLKESAFVKNNSDSGIVSDSVSIENESISKKLTDFPTDENCNILPSYDNKDKFDQPYKYVCTEVQTKIITQICDSFEKHPVIYKNQRRNTCLFKLLGDDVSSEVATVNTQKTAVKIDLLHELNIRNCTSILSSILSYLPEEDLRIASYVSKQWQNIVFNDKFANDRRKAYIKNKKNVASGPNKENRFQTPSSSQRHHKNAFVSVVNAKSETLQPLIFDDLSGKFDSFIEEAKMMKDKDVLMKCPKCLYPSKAESENKFCCTRKLCQHEFCKKCSGPYLNNHLCSVPELNDNLPKMFIGSKKSKKNLRRL